MQAVFATRDVILRSDGRIRYLRLTTRTQIIAVVVLTVIGFSAVAASIGMGVQQLSIRGHDIEVRNADDAYTRLLTEVTGYFDQFSKSAAVAVSDETYLLGLSGGAGLVVPRMARWAALLMGTMVFSWFWIVHLPRAFLTVSDGIAVFEALAVSGMALMIAGYLFRHEMGR